MIDPHNPTRADLAVAFGKSERWIGELRSRGVLPKSGTLAENIDAYMAHNAGQGDDLDYQKERARLTKEQADAAEMKNAQLRAELFPLTMYQHAMQSVFVSVRAGLLAIPNDLAPQIVTASDRREAAEMLTDAIHRALESLSETNFDELLQGAGGSDGEGGADPEAAAEADAV